MPLVEPEGVIQTDKDYTAVLGEMRGAVDLIVQGTASHKPAQSDQGVTQYKVGLAKLDLLYKADSKGNLRPDASIYLQMADLKKIKPL